MENQFRHHILEMQLEELKSRIVIAKSPCMINALQQALKVSKSDSTVLILENPASGKDFLPMSSIKIRRVPKNLSSKSTVGPFQNRWSSPNCSAMKRGPSREPREENRASWNWPTAAFYFL